MGLMHVGAMDRRIELLVTWFIGDTFKTGFFLFRHSPMQFVLCGLIQLAVDIGIAIQMFVYPRGNRLIYAEDVGIDKATHRPLASDSSIPTSKLFLHKR